MVHFDSFSTGKKLGLLIGSAMLGILIMAAVCLISERQMIMMERQSNVSQNVEVAHGLIVYFHNEVSQGKMTDEEGRQRALQTIKGLRYNGSEYFWVNDLSPKMIMHPIKPDLDGNDLTNYKDPTGKPLFVEFVKTVKTSGSGFVFYMWPKPGSANPVQKVSFVKGFAPWGWIIGSGVYSLRG